MSSQYLSSPFLYKSAAALYAITIPGHILMGLQSVHPLLSSLVESTDERRIAKRGAQNAWNYLNASLLIGALLNIKWARTGVTSPEEKGVAWAYLLIGLLNGFRYVQTKSYAPLVCMWAAPALSVVALSKE